MGHPVQEGSGQSASQGNQDDKGPEAPLSGDKLRDLKLLKLEAQKDLVNVHKHLRERCT